MRILNLAEAMQLAELLDKPELSGIDDSFEMDEFAAQVLEALNDDELETFLLLLFGDEITVGDTQVSLTDVAEALVQNGYLQLIEAYHKLKGVTNG